MDGKVYPPVQTPSGSVTPPAAGPPPQMPPQMHQPPPQTQPQQQQQQQQSRQRQSPNVTPPLRPLIPQGAPNTGYNSSPNMFQPGGQFPPGMRGYGNDSRFPMPGMGPTMGPPQTQVSSSTHPHMGNGQ